MEVQSTRVKVNIPDGKLEGAVSDRPSVKKDRGETIKISEKEHTPEELGELVNRANDFFKITHTHLHFQLHESTNKYYVEVRNSENNEVIREIPTKKFLDMIAKFSELAGLVVDEKI